ncbi:MAG: response regulator transcription factor [Clostridiaceae bacterium]
MNNTILIADDNEEILKVLKNYISKENYNVIIAHDGHEALSKFKEYNPNLILLDIMMPKLDGLSVCKEIRKKSNVPIIMVTAKSEDGDKILGLDTGADDYIVKPFSPGEVVARIRAILRRVIVTDKEKPSLVKYPNLEIDLDNHIVKINEINISFTRKELEVLWILTTSPNQIISRDFLLDEVWGIDYYGDPRTVDTHLKRIRAKLNIKDEYLWDIKTVWGKGYKFEVKNE